MTDPVAKTETATTAASAKGLAGVVAGDSRLSKVYGEEGRLEYCGYAVEDLAEKATFEECIFLLWNQRLPRAAELAALRRELSASAAVPGEVWDLLAPLARRASQMDLLRTGVSALSAFDPDVAASKDVTDVAEHLRLDLAIAKRLMARMGTLVAGIWRLSQGQRPGAPDPSRSYAADFLALVTGRPPRPEEARLFDAALTLHADHGFNASTFAARVTAGTESDVYSCITSAIGTLAGRLHGGANERVMRMLREIGEVDRAEAWVTRVLADPKGRVMGFGHRVYKVEDPRARVLRRMAKDVTAKTGHGKWYDLSLAIEAVVKRTKPIFPNVDFYSASVYASLGLDPAIFTPIFAVSRTSGWLAHVMEQHGDNRLIRPRANYLGEAGRAFVPLAER